MTAKHVPKLPDDQVNLPKRHPIREVLELITAAIVISGVLFFSLGYITERLILFMSPAT